MVSGSQLAFGFGQVEGTAVGFRISGNEVDNEGYQCRDMSLEDEPAVSLSFYYFGELHGSHQHYHCQYAQSAGQLVADNLRTASHGSNQREFIVGAPACQQDTHYADTRCSQHQDELAALLEKEGFTVTQATISRDIRELNLTKSVSPDGGQKYSIAVSALGGIYGKYLRVLSDGILKMEIAENILVIKTVSGMAMAVGAAVDAMSIENVVGCIAGDDTIMCIIKTKEDAPVVKARIEEAI